MLQRLLLHLYPNQLAECREGTGNNYESRAIPRSLDHHEQEVEVVEVVLVGRVQAMVELVPEKVQEPVELVVVEDTRR